MPDINAKMIDAESDAGGGRTDQTRRRILLLLPAGIFAAIAATLVNAAARILRPRHATTNGSGAWTPLAPVTELAGARPVRRRIMTERIAGWTRARAEHVVYVLPYRNHAVVSAVCPHEGCEVAWRDDARDFFCPCHDSRFAPDGGVLSGPAQRGLAQLPTRVENGVLEVQADPPASGDAPESDRNA